MRILFLTEGTSVPASRFRVGQFIPHFEARGVEAVVRAGYGEHYNAFAKTKLAAPYQLLTRLRRVPYSFDAARFDVVFIQRPTLPFTGLPERLVTMLNQRTIFDVDDAIWMSPIQTRSRFRSYAFETNVQLCRHLICGNRVLADKANQPHKTSIIPTVIDTDRYAPAAPSASGPLVIGWMGTASNFGSVEPILPAIRQVLDAHPDAVFRVVSNRHFEVMQSHPRFEEVPWSKAAELSQLHAFDIGLMPLNDNEATRAKCGFKMIQYMSVGRPVIVSPVGANVEILEQSGAGFFATTHDEWVDALSQLVTSPELRAVQGAAGRARAVAEYSITAVIDRYMEIFERVANA